MSPFVDGKPHEAASDETIEVVNPASGRVLLEIPAGCAADVDTAVAAARRACDDRRWSDAAPSMRKKVLHRWADLVAAEHTALDALDAGEMGKPVSTAAFSAAGAAEHVRFNAEAIDKVFGDVYASDRHSFVVQRRRPRGVVAAIVPWNFPTYNAVLKLAPALAAGNTVVLKPSELSSRSALRLAQLAIDAGLPPGVFNVVPGRGETVGRALALHNEVNMVAFTGSTEVGKLMMQYAGQSNMKVVMAECGGKSPQIVFDDGVDLDAAAASIAASMLTNQGQWCSVGSRLLVQRSIADLMTQSVSRHMQRIVMGDPLDSTTTFGPVASKSQFDRVMRYIGIGQEQGAHRVTGGRHVLRETGGYFIEPTVFANVSPVATIAQEEIFGPVLTVIPFDDEAEAIRIANGTSYGLAAYVWTSRIATGMRLANAIPSMVFIHADAPKGEGAGHAASWEPTGLSGLGAEGGLPGLESYLHRQMVWVSHG